MTSRTLRNSLSPVPDQVEFVGADNSPDLAKFNFSGVDPLIHFPVAILSRALDFARSNRLDSATDEALTSLEPCPERRMLTSIALVLDHSRRYWGSEHTSPVEFIRFDTAASDSATCGVRCPNGLILHLPRSFVQEGSPAGVGEQFLLSDSGGRVETVPLFDSTKRLISSAVERGVVHGAPALVFPGLTEGDDKIHRDLALGVLAILRNSPYDARFQSGSAEKVRFRFISALNEGDWGGEREFLTRVMQMRPSLLGQPGWCRGTAFHKAAQLGHEELLGELLDLATKLQDAPPVIDLLSKPDADGCTPLHLASRYGRLECAEMLRRAGSPVLVDRFGFKPKK